jgi:xylose dehydrogenase (NAD/NADP)
VGSALDGADQQVSARRARESDCVEVIAVASRERARAEAYARKNLIERAYDGYEALIADTEVDAVYISLPNALHVEWTLRALEAGKHVLTEKPFSRRAAEVEAAFDVADRYELVLSEGFMWRHHPQTRALEDLLAGNAEGPNRVLAVAPDVHECTAGELRIEPRVVRTVYRREREAEGCAHQTQPPSCTRC